MKAPDISVIVPVYNGEKYLRIFMDSLIAQDKVELEFILVNNGATDQSDMILEEYAHIDHRIRIITLAENQGVYGARNVGIKNALGKYLAFADCDDYICPGAYAALYRAACLYNSDVVIGGFQHVYDSGEIIPFQPESTKGMFEPLMCGGAIWNKLFRHSFIEANNIRFPPKNHMEDNLFLGYVYRYRPSISIEKYDVYHYMQRVRDYENRLTASTLNSVVQSFESVQELYSMEIPCENDEVFRCFFGALHYLKDLWFNMENADEQEMSYKLFRETIFVLSWEGREEFFRYCFKINYRDFLEMTYTEFISTALRFDHNEILQMQRKVELPAQEVVVKQYEEGKAGLQDMHCFLRAWWQFKKRRFQNNFLKILRNFWLKIKSISPIFILIIFYQYTFRGYLLYKKMSQKFGEDTHFLLIPYEGTGDAYITGCMLKRYVQEHYIQKYQIIQPLSRGKKVLSLFREEAVCTITIEERNWLSQFQLFASQAIERLHVMHFHPCNHICIQNRIEGINKVSFQKMYEIAGFNIEPERELPGIAKEREVEGQFCRRGLKVGKTVILAPYAETIPTMPEEAWIYIAKALSDAGYCVCTNSMSEKEPVIPGTQRVSYGYAQMIPILHLAGWFIGVRSGLCDVISSSKCKKIIVYPKSFFWGQGEVSKYFSLKAMGFCSDVIEVEFEKNGWKEAADKIIKELK